MTWHLFELVRKGPRHMALRPRGPSEAQEPLLRVDAGGLRGG